MIKKIVHTIKTIIIRAKYKAHNLKHKRSSHWTTVRNKFLIKNNICAACGTTKKLNVHHKIPFYIAPNLELDITNLITLCMDEKDCHFHLAHLGSFKKYNPYLEADLAAIRNNPEQFDQIVKNAKLRK